MRWLVLLLMLVGCEKDGLTVGVASSLTDVMQDVAARHEAATGVPVTVVAASSGRIAQQQRAGAGYDAVVLASADLAAVLRVEVTARLYLDAVAARLTRASRGRRPHWLRLCFYRACGLWRAEYVYRTIAARRRAY